MQTADDLPDALKRVLQSAEQNQAQIVRTSQIQRADRELLLRLGWLEEIIQGWYMLAKPDVAPGNSTAWYANFWDFVRLYLSHHYGEDYCLSAESSIDLHLDKPAVPKQIVVICAKGGGHTRQLPHDTSLLIYRDPKKTPASDVKVKGINTMGLARALCQVSPTFFRTAPQDAEIALRLIREPAELLRVIIQDKIQRPAARLIGAYQFLGDESFAQTLTNSLAEQGFSLKPENPFVAPAPLLTQRVRSPYVARIMSIWQRYRDDIIKLFPKEPGLPKNSKKYMQDVQENYKNDAYNSLSIEGYKVSLALIEKVANNQWNPDSNAEDAEQRNALAARGYYETFQAVKKTILKVLRGEQPGIIMENDLSSWYKSLFNPMVQAKIIQATDLLGYRNDQVYIRNSRHTPLPVRSLLDAMETSFDCLKHEEHAGVRSVLGHFIFVFIHPYMDGNGRIGRFIMNAMLASGGYPWTIIHVENRNQYLSALEAASVEENIVPFTKFIISEMNVSAK